MSGLKMVTIKSQRLGAIFSGKSDDGLFVYMTMEEAKKGGLLRKVRTMYPKGYTGKVAYIEASAICVRMV